MEKTKVIKIDDHYGEHCFNDSMCPDRTERKPLGMVHIFEVDEEGQKKLIQKSNLVVYQGRSIVACRMFNMPNLAAISDSTAVQNEFICWLGLGNGGAPSQNPFVPYVANSTDTDLQSKIMINPTDATCSGFSSILGGYTKHPFDSVDFEQDSSNNNAYLICRVITSIGTNDANGSQINEAGLYTAASNSGNYTGPFHLFARVTFPTLVKDSTRPLLFVWYIYV